MKLEPNLMRDRDGQEIPGKASLRNHPQLRFGGQMGKRKRVDWEASRLVYLW